MNTKISIFQNIIKKISSSSYSEFKPYYKKENDFSRLAILYGFSAFIISPIFCYLIYNTSVPERYFQIGISFTIIFPLYISLCYFIKALRDKLIYFFITHLYLVSFYAFFDLIESNLAIKNLFYFFSFFATVLYIMQRLYPAILYNIFIFFLLIYSFNIIENPETSIYGILGMFFILAICSIIILISRKKLINNTEDYSDYLKKIVNNSGIGFVLFKLTKKNENVLDSNPESIRLLNCTKDTLSSTVYTYLSDEEKTLVLNLRIGTTFKKTIIVKSKLSERSVDFVFRIIALKNGLYWILRIVDVSDKHKEKLELANREKKYRNLYYRNQAGVFTTNSSSIILDCNQAFEEMFDGEITKGKILFKEPNNKEWQEILELIQSKENLKNYQTHFTLKNGVVKWFIFNWYLDASTNQIEGTLIDVTDVQKASGALKQSEEKYRLIYEESNDAIELLEDDKIIDVNRKGIQLFGIPKRDLLSLDLFTLSFDTNELFKIEYEKHKQKLLLLKSTKFNWIFKGNNQRIEAEVAIIELMLGDEKYYQCVIHDLTQRNESMRSLEKNKESFKSVLDNTPEGIIIVSGESILYTNPEMYKLISGSEIQLNDLFIKKDQKIFKTLMEQQIIEKKIIQYQLRLNNTETKDQLVDVTLVSTNFEEKESVLIIIKDISLQNKLSKEMLRAEVAEETNIKLAEEIKERIKTETLLQEQFLRSNAIFDSSSNTLLLTLDTKYNISSFNTHCQNYFWYLTEKKIEIDDYYANFFKNIFSKIELRSFRKTLNQVKKGESKQFETHFFSKGIDRWVELFINPIFDIEGIVTEISLVAHDITDKKKTEKEIVESLKEKEVLLKEIHHRVKNNLQVISSILNLQSSYVKDKKTLEILDESRNRIRSMAIIHENLYRTTNFSSIDFSSYLQNLSANLISSYHVQASKVHLLTDMEKVELVLDQAIPCGLLVNELITNAIKYAFENEKDGEIFIGLKEVKGIIMLSIEDNGVGLPKNFDISKSDTLGLQLVSTLVEQLDGEIIVSSMNGTKYLITFDKAKL